MDAMARPGIVTPLATTLAPPPPLAPAAGAMALALLDYETRVWLDPMLAASDVASWLRFHAGAPVTADPADAAFAFVSDPAAMPALDEFAQGSPEYPDRSTTLVLQVERFAGAPVTLAGPGIAKTQAFAAAPLPDDFVAQLAANRARFPRGVDLVFVTADAIAGLPRSTRIVPEG